MSLGALVKFELTEPFPDVVVKQLELAGYDLLEVISIPWTSDPMVRARTLESALPTHNDIRSVLIQYRQKSIEPELQKISLASDELVRTGLEEAYHSDGKVNLEFLERNAEILMASGEYPLARNIYKALLKSGVNPSRALFGAGRCYELERRYDRALACYEESIAYHALAVPMKHLATILIHQGKHQYAAETLERFLALGNISREDSIDAHKACGNSWVRAGNPGKAEKYFIKAIELDPRSDDSMVSLGLTRLAVQDLVQAQRWFSSATAINPRNERAWMGLGSAHLTLGNYQAAHDAFSETLKIQIKNPTAISHILKCAFKIKSYSVAEELVSRYLDVSPANVNVMYSLAGLRFHIGKLELAEKGARNILEMKPGHPGASELLELIGKYIRTRASK